MSGTPAGDSSTGAGTAVLELRGLCLQAGGQHLVNGLNLCVYPHQRWCVIGRNASGKSTLLRALAGLAVPALQGAVLLQGRNQALADAAEAARLRAYLPQQAQDRFAIRVLDLLALQARDADALQPQALALAQALDIAPLLPRAVTQLSGGERQRVALAALAMQDASAGAPSSVPLWLLDEPVSFQDPAHQRLVSRWLCEQSQQPGRAQIISAHDMAWVQHTATHVLALLPGGAWQAGPVHEVLDAATLEAVFGCAWQALGSGAQRIWVAQ